MNKRILQAITWLILVLVLIAIGFSLGRIEDTHQALEADEPAWGVGRAESTARLYASSAGCQRYHSIAEFTEGEGEPPAWYKPDEDMAAEWVAAEAHPPVGIDHGGIDWGVETTLYGWNGHKMTVLELDIFSKIVYLEFNGTSPECIEAGIDSILRLWESEYFGQTLFETLSAVTESGARAYTTYDYIWSSCYDANILADIRAMCEERFKNAPVWIAPFFQLYGYPSWAEPCYELCGVYFSTFKEVK